MESLFLGFGPAIITTIAAFFFYTGLRDSQKTSWIKIALGISLLWLVCGWLIALVISDWGVIAFTEVLFASGAAVLAGIWLIWSLARWRKLAGLLLGVGFPFVLFISLEVGFPYSPDSIIRKNGNVIARALNEYYADKGNYPEILDELVPTYLADLREPETIWGWLYRAGEDDFTLGYVFYVDKLGYTICKYSRTAPEWNCPLDYSTTPFHLAPTPMP